MALIDDVQNLVLFSFSLSPERKDEVIRALPNLAEDKLNELKTLFEEEEKRKNEIIKDAVEKNPALAEKIEKIMREGVGNMYKEVEKSEEGVEEKEMESLLTDLDKPENKK
jgi:hypothetical protein